MAFVSFSMWFCFFLLYQVHYVATHISQDFKWQAIEIDFGLFKQKKYLPELLRDLKPSAQGYQPRAVHGATEVTWGSFSFHRKAVGVAPQCLKYLAAMAAITSRVKMLPQELSLVGASSLLVEFCGLCFSMSLVLKPREAPCVSWESPGRVTCIEG